MVISVTTNERLAEDLRILLQHAGCSEIYNEKIGDREVILAIRATSAMDCEIVKQVLIKSGIDNFTMDHEAA